MSAIVWINALILTPALLVTTYVNARAWRLWRERTKEADNTADTSIAVVNLVLHRTMRLLSCDTCGITIDIPRTGLSLRPDAERETMAVECQRCAPDWVFAYAWPDPDTPPPD